jgi:glycosyltransferase involved in cell wall biosynthesis
MKRRTKVVHLTEDMGIGGQEKVIAILAEGLDRRKFEAEVWCLVRGGALADKVRQAGITVRVLNLPSYYNPLSVLRLALLLRRFVADIVHTHGDFAGTFGRLAAVLAGKRAVVAHVHTLQPGFRWRHLWTQRVLAHFTRRIICVSQAVRDFVIAGTGIPAGKTCLILNGVVQCADHAGCPERQAGLALGDCLAVSVGSLVENKGHRVLVDAFHQAVSVRPTLKLVIVGDGPLRAVLKRQVIDLNLQAHVEFSGRLDDVHSVLDQAAMFILPTLYREGLSIALLEASRHGLPAVASRLGGIPEVIAHGRTGLLVPPGDAEALAAAILALAADSCLRARLGDAARSDYERRFRAERMVAEIETLYASLFMDERCAT